MHFILISVLWGPEDADTSLSTRTSSTVVKRTTYFATLIDKQNYVKKTCAYTSAHCVKEETIDDENHIIMTCPHYKSLRLKFVKLEYHERPSMRKFKRLLSSRNDDLQKLMTFIKLVLKEYNLRLHRH